MKNQDKYFDANQALWDAKTPHHLKSDFYDMEAFKKGKNVLREIELEALPDVKGKSILHLQCHFGQDTLCLSRMGAKCTGVNFSGKAIETARELNNELGLDAQFIQSNIFDLKDKLDEKFDIIYTSYGVLCWLPTLEPWAEIISHFLKSGGTFIIAEFHPSIYMLDWDNLKIGYDYFNKETPDHDVTDGTYADSNATIKMDEYFWSHSMEEIIMNLMNNGLKLESFKEYPFSPYPCFPNLEKIGEYRWKIKGIDHKIPYTFSMKMKKN
jgi:SAM-dependent methyltransferase